MAIRIKGLRVSYPGSRLGVEARSLEVEPGELVALTGPNGGGKTTLLRVIAGLIPSFYPARVEGLVEVDGYDPRLGVDPGLAVYMQPDPTVQVVGVTVLHEASLCPMLRGLPRGETLARAGWALKSLGLEGMEGESTPLLSSGVLQRVALAGVASCRPRYLLLDEPTGHLDPWAGEVVRGLLRRLSSMGLGLLVATHDWGLVEAADRVYTVNRGVNPGAWRHPQPPNTPERSPGDRVLEAEGLEVGYPGAPPILRGVTLEARQGELVALTGPNGGGKTTLLRALAGLLKPLRGKLRARTRRRYLPANPLLVFSRPRLREELKGEPPLPVGHLLDRPVATLSSGELQLAALAVVASSGPGILLLDEPTHALDPVNRAEVVKALAALAGAGYTIVAATHDPWLAGASDRVYRVEGGGVSQL
ncbi:MAG: ATP-binding cassette domain-containing protein [Desulfurococcales archaeon]|nr:ATP-binding cassette domain-containing protein [Desulfurococcales archaeon]